MRLTLPRPPCAGIFDGPEPSQPAQNRRKVWDAVPAEPPAAIPACRITEPAYGDYPAARGTRCFRAARGLCGHATPRATGHAQPTRALAHLLMLRAVGTDLHRVDAVGLSRFCPTYYHPDGLTVLRRTAAPRRKGQGLKANCRCYRFAPSQGGDFPIPRPTHGGCRDPARYIGSSGRIGGRRRPSVVLGTGFAAQADSLVRFTRVLGHGAQRRIWPAQKREIEAIQALARAELQKSDRTYWATAPKEQDAGGLCMGRPLCGRRARPSAQVHLRAGCRRGKDGSVKKCIDGGKTASIRGRRVARRSC